ncbi:hypothetical protein BS636_00025 [Acinetobacter sp. LoGeW2-3]|uniref:MFS transporter n=1 Tax=Acinetobacter sp. LoGeW2-3 TaxID=1808001 RepID=UPI000C058742|nr:MFS transporter [Acinetobacter sp. LoGeW2-3]ATO18182.1 hypothetical protein BS636_00025 [Acinetobacter sp. LoGeW2-3]
MNMAGDTTYSVWQLPWQNLIWGAVQPVTGAITDKYGSKLVVAVGGALYALGLLLMAISSTALDVESKRRIDFRLGAFCYSFPVLLSAVGRAAHPEKRSLAMGIASAAGSFGQFIMLPSTLLLLQSIGWSAALGGECDSDCSYSSACLDA